MTKAKSPYAGNFALCAARGICNCICIRSTRAWGLNAAASAAADLGMSVLILAQDQGSVGAAKAEAVGHNGPELSITGRGNDIKALCVLVHL